VAKVVDGPAFPNSYIRIDNKEQTISTGIMMRDYFAASALAGLLARSDLSVPHCDGCLPVGEDAGVHYSDIAYRYADAMLKERAK